MSSFEILHTIPQHAIVTRATMSKEVMIRMIESNSTLIPELDDDGYLMIKKADGVSYIHDIHQSIVHIELKNYCELSLELGKLLLMKDGISCLPESLWIIKYNDKPCGVTVELQINFSINEVESIIQKHGKFMHDIKFSENKISRMYLYTSGVYVDRYLSEAKVLLDTFESYDDELYEVLKEWVVETPFRYVNDSMLNRLIDVREALEALIECKDKIMILHGSAKMNKDRINRDAIAGIMTSMVFNAYITILLPIKQKILFDQAIEVLNEDIGISRKVEMLYRIIIHNGKF